MKTKLALLLVVFMVAFATPAMAQKIQPLNIFPWTPVEIDVPLYAADPESTCLTDIVGTICEVDQDGGTLVTKDIPYSGTLTVPYSGNALFSGELPVTASGTVSFDTYNVIPGGGQFTYAVLGAGICGDVDETTKQNCCEIKGNPDGSVHLVCYKVPAENVVSNETFTYDICQAQTVDVPWSYTGTAPFLVLFLTKERLRPPTTARSRPSTKNMVQPTSSLPRATSFSTARPQRTFRHRPLPSESWSPMPTSERPWSLRLQDTQPWRRRSRTRLW